MNLTLPGTGSHARPPRRLSRPSSGRLREIGLAHSRGDLSEMTRAHCRTVRQAGRVDSAAEIGSATSFVPEYCSPNPTVRLG